MPRPSPLALALLAAALLAAPAAQAIDCRKAASPIERTICADRRLQAADAAMGAAYAATLKAAGDEGIRAMLVASQRRWLLRRDAQLGHLDAVDDGQGPPDEATRREIVLKAIRDRTRVLSQSGIHNPYQRRLVEVALAQRAFEARYTGGPFAGYQTSCDFLPQAGSYSYGCFGTQRFQHHDRVCSVNQDWASGSVSERREVGRVVNGRLTAVASCSIGGGKAGQACPDDDAKGKEARWPAQLDAEATRNEAPPVRAAPLLDADVGEIDQGWLAACLGDAAYPPR